MAGNKFEYYDELKNSFEKYGWTVEMYREINSGLQFYIESDGRKSLVRVYESKKGVRLDLSQVKDEGILKQISDCLEKDEESGKKKCMPKVEVHDDPAELIGTDESGKGDYFGPLVIAGVYADIESGKQLKAMGVDDSKKLSDTQIAKLAVNIKQLCPYSVVVIGNEKYNELYERINNLNKLLAWGHARAIENVLGKVECRFVLSDQFGDPSLIKNALMEKGKKVTLYQRPRGEENIAVAAASILARDEFVAGMAVMEQNYGIRFPKGASSGIIETGREFVAKFGRDNLKSVAKLHFKTTECI